MFKCLNKCSECTWASSALSSTWGNKRAGWPSLTSLTLAENIRDHEWVSSINTWFYTPDGTKPSGERTSHDLTTKWRKQQKLKKNRSFKKRDPYYKLLKTLFLSQLEEFGRSKAYSFSSKITGYVDKCSTIADNAYLRCQMLKLLWQVTTIQAE